METNACTDIEAKIYWFELVPSHPKQGSPPNKNNSLITFQEFAILDDF